MKKICKPVLLLAKEKTDIILVGDWNKLAYKISGSSMDEDESFQHLYIVREFDQNDESSFIKIGDWALNPRNPTGEIVQCNKSNELSIQEHWKLIISCTDSSLDLPGISETFINEYCSQYNKGNIISEVEVEYIGNYYTDDYDYDNTHLTAIYLSISKENNIIISLPQQSSFTKEEMFLNMHEYHIDNIVSEDYYTPEEWWDKFKQS